MRRGTLKLLVKASAVYVLFLVFLRSLIPGTGTPTLTLLVLPLVILVVLLVSDLFYRATAPSKTPVQRIFHRFQARDVQYLSRQVEVASSGGKTYFESVLLNRLREILAEKLSLETGIEKKIVKQDLASPMRGPSLIGDKALYALLYSSTPPKGAARIKMLREAIDGIEAWKA